MQNHKGDEVMLKQNKDCLMDFNAEAKNGFPCYTCGRHYQHAHSLQSHLGLKHPNVCQELPDGKIIMPIKPKKHFRTFTRWECEVCQKTYKNRISLSNHVYRHHPGISSMVVNNQRIIPKPIIYKQEKIKCKICRVELSCEVALKRHLNKVHEGQRLKNRIKREIAESKKRSLVVCTECPKVFFSSYALKHHIAAVHADKLPYSKNGITVDKNSFKDLNKINCLVCGKTMKRVSLYEHLRIKHASCLPITFEDKIITANSVEKRFSSCPECDLPLGKYFLVNHFRKCHQTLLPYMIDEHFTIAPATRIQKVSAEFVTINAPQDVKHYCSKCDFDTSCNLAFFIHLKMFHGTLLNKELSKFN